MWEVWYGLEATNYLADNGQLVADLFFKMESLAESEGWPKVGEYELENDLILWQIVKHLVVYQRLEENFVVQIVSIKPI